VFGLVGQMTGSSRLSIVSLVIFFIVGGALLLTVDVKKGRAMVSQGTFLPAWRDPRP
jgi:UMF1 family MFS transporter